MNIAIEMNKLNIVVLKNGGKISTNEEWYFKNIILKVVSYYKYLRICFNYQFD